MSEVKTKRLQFLHMVSESLRDGEIAQEGLLEMVTKNTSISSMKLVRQTISQMVVAYGYSSIPEMMKIF